MNDTHFGDYSVTKARGRWTGICHHCGHSAAKRGYVGHAEEAIRQHLRDAHHLAPIRRDVRETWWAR